MNWNEPTRQPRRGGTRKIRDLPKAHFCRHPSHNPPGHMVFQPGVYEHVCPGCGHTQIFTVGYGPMMSVLPPSNQNDLGGVDEQWALSFVSWMH